MAVKTEVPGLYKEGEGILINKDNDALVAYKKRKEQNYKMKSLEQEVLNIKSDLQEIKNLLRGLIR